MGSSPSRENAPAALEPIAKDQAPILHNLFQLYAHDFSEYVPLELGGNGRFDVTIGEQWWNRDGHFPFFIRWNGKAVWVRAGPPGIPRLRRE